MRPQLELIEKIEQYLQGKLSPADKASFESQMTADPALQEEVRLQQEIMRGVQRSALRNKVQSARVKYRRGKNFMKWGLGGLGVVVVAAVAFYFAQKTRHNPERDGYDGSGVPIQGELLRNIYRIDASKDTVIETPGGIVMAIPANGFVDDDGKPVDGIIDLNIREALDPASIMKAGLSTMSGNQLLETGGMFYLDARKDGDELKIDPSKTIHTEIPTDTVREGMQLYKGQRKSDGSIDWIDPKPLTRDLVAVDINQLIFYPPLYLDSVQSWGYDSHNKNFTDSLYYSFARYFTNDQTLDGYLDGQAIFKSKCATCHIMGLDAVGQDLTGVVGRWNGDIPKLRKFIRNWKELADAGDKKTLEIINFNTNTDMQIFGTSLSDAQIDAILRFTEQYSHAKPAPWREEISGQHEGALTDSTKKDIIYPQFDYSQTHCGINPVKIKSIWNETFQNTLLSTREFEERIPHIHRRQLPEILDLYVNNLDKNMWEIDLMAAKLFPTDTTSHNVFLDFAARRDGKVRNGTTQFQKLKEYYSSKTKAYTDAIAKTQAEFWQKQSILDVDAWQKKYGHDEDSMRRMSQNFSEEFTMNVKEAYMQLGYPDITPRTARPVYTAEINATGWWNVDKLVLESTLTRTTLDYTDPATGKRAVIRYEPVSFQIENANEYDRLYVYLLPDKLSSFMKLTGQDGVFTEKLNELMSYKMVAIGYKDEQAYFFSQGEIRPGSYPSMTMTQITNDELDLQLNRFGRGNQPQDLIKEKDFLRFEIKDQKRQQHNIELQQLTEKTRKVIFPCEFYFPVEYSAK